MTTYITDDDGKFIPASQRPDGTWRKARRVKQGYVPQEEVPLYESKGKQFANRKSTVPPGFCPFANDPKKAQKDEPNKSKPKGKQQQQNQQQQQQPGILVLPLAAGVKKIGKIKSAQQTQQQQQQPQQKSASDKAVDALTPLLVPLSIEDGGADDVGKKLKKLRKKLREIELIEEKLKSGDLKKPEKEQLEKVKRKKELLKEMKRLEVEETKLAAATKTPNAAQ